MQGWLASLEFCPELNSAVFTIILSFSAGRLPENKGTPLGVAAYYLTWNTSSCTITEAMPS